MAISQRRYVDIASAVIGASGTAQQKLVGRVFTDHPLLPAQSILAFSEAAEVRAYFGAGKEADFATKYFALTTPAPVSRPKELQFASHLLAVRNASQRGTAQASLADLKALTAESLSVTVTDGTGSPTTYTVTAAFGSAASYTDVASIIQTALQLEDPALNLTFDNGFILSVTTADSTVLADDGTLASALGLDGSAIVDIGCPVQTMADAYAASIQRTNSYGSAFFMTRGDLAECIDVAELNAAENVRHMLFLQVTAAERVAFSTALIETASVGLILETPGEKYLAHLPMALQAATDYTRRNATMNYMYRQAGVTVESQVTDTLTANLMDPSRINYYGMTAEAGSSIKFFQRAFLCGNPSAPLDMSVHSNEQWLKARIGALWFDLMIGTRGIPANLDGVGRGLQVISQVVEEALNNGSIIAGKTLTVTQRLAVTDASGDDLAWTDVQNTGVWYNVEIVEQSGPSLVAEYVLKYVLIYAKGDWVRKIEGSHSLL